MKKIIKLHNTNVNIPNLTETEIAAYKILKDIPLFKFSDCVENVMECYRISEDGICPISPHSLSEEIKELIQKHIKDNL